MYSHSSGQVDNISSNSALNGGALVGGGLVGTLTNGVVYASYSASEVDITGFSASTAGGLIGSVTGGTVTESYSTGSVRSTVKDYISASETVTPTAGGLFGRTAGTGSSTPVNADIRRSVSFAESVGAYVDNVRVAGFDTIAANISGSSGNTTYTDVYSYGGMALTADNQTGETGIPVSDKTPPESFYINLGWDFERIWSIGANGYPEHKKR
jgi:hypothetical protein